MFCSECGTKLNESAKFCFNCGTKLSDSQAEKAEICSSSAINEKESPYATYMKSEMMNAYIRNRDISASYFYSKAKFYNLNETQVDKIFDYVLGEIEKFKKYIDELYKECKEVLLSKYLVEELVGYGEVNGISREISLSFLEYYNKSNELVDKRKILEYVLDKFSQTGRVDTDIPEKLTKLKTISIEELLVIYNQEISEMMLEIDKEYKKIEGRDTLNKKQRSYLGGIASRKVFVSDDIKNLISGYERQTGIYDRRVQTLKEEVYKNFDKQYAQMYILFGRQIIFDAKYFTISVGAHLSCKAQDNYQEKFEDIERSSPDACVNIEKVFVDYTQELSDDIEEIESLLAFSFNDSSKEKIDAIIQKIWSNLGDLHLTFEEIAEDKKISKEERARRKAMRGRWEGGGFGVGGAIKGAVTAGAMNAVTGLVHSGVNMVGNAISSSIANSNRKNAVKDFFNTTESLMSEIRQELWEFYIEIIAKNYPKLQFIPDIHDSAEEKNMRKKLLGTEENREDKAIELLMYNPYNPLNILAILMSFRDSWNQSMDKTFSVMEEQFKWIESIRDLSKEYSNTVKSILKDEPEDSISDESVIDALGELLMLLEAMDKADEDSKQIYEQLLKKKEYVDWLKRIDTADNKEIIEYGNRYCNNNEYSKAKNTYVKSVQKNTSAVDIVEQFFENVDKFKIVKALDEFVKNKGRLSLDEYSSIMFIFARMLNHEKKTLLVYAAETHHHVLINELIKNGADVNMLYQLVGKQNNTEAATDKTQKTQNVLVCKACGKHLNINTKFCNYCGHKVE